MKYIVVLSDGMSDYPLPELGGKTPMEYANKPNMDSLASKGEMFLVKTVPDELSPGSDVANLAVMGYDPMKYYTGRSPLEAASIGVTLAPDDTSYRANLVSLSGECDYEDKTMLDYSSGEITTAESAEIIKTLAESINTNDLKLYCGVSYRHLLVKSGKNSDCELTPPHDISDKPIKEYLPKDELTLSVMKKSYEILKNHPVNKKRRAEGKHTADSLWIWGRGKSASLPSFKEKTDLSGAVISAVDLVRGIGYLADMEVIKVPNVTGNIDTNFDGKAKAAVDALMSGKDYVYIHLEAPDECGHQGNAKLKAKSIELIDKKIVGYICSELSEKGEDYRIMVLPDHPTPVSIKTHARDPVPCFIYDSRFEKESKSIVFSEKNAEGKMLDPGYRLIDYFLERSEFN
ncbi:MAG: cofactor-independent phosphoglycerate mutase [Clostridia bacterium]|nr:cofactor-independent phosphoglycerate mutase [Clostridia bacterium]